MKNILCWQTFNCKNSKHIQPLINAGFNGLRIFIDMADLPKMDGLSEKSDSNTWQGYINHIFTYMPDGLHAWTWEGKTGLFCDNTLMRDSFDFCKEKNWLPICCFGYREETPYNFLAVSQTNRAPRQDVWEWLARLTYEFGYYLKNTLKFTAADCEIWNEPQKLEGLGFGWDSYVTLSLKMCKQWKKLGTNFKTHVFADDIQKTEYLDNLINHIELMATVNYVSAHIGVGSEDSEWDNNLIKKTYDKIKAKNSTVKLAVTEMSVNGIWDRLNQLPGNVEMQGGILWIRKKAFGTATRIDDLWMTDGDNIECSSPDKVNIITNFNKANGDSTMPTYNSSTQLTPNFKYGEFFCLGKQPPDSVYPNILALAKELQKVRDKVKVPIVINSGWRDETHNEVVGGASNSQHLEGKAADVYCPKIITKEFNIYLAKYGNFNGFGIGSNYTHVDTRSAFGIWSY